MELWRAVGDQNLVQTALDSYSLQRRWEREDVRSGNQEGLQGLGLTVSIGSTYAAVAAEGRSGDAGVVFYKRLDGGRGLQRVCAIRDRNSSKIGAAIDQSDMVLGPSLKQRPVHQYIQKRPVHQYIQY